MTEERKKMTEASEKLRKEAEEEIVFIRRLGFCSFGIGSHPAAVDVKHGKRRIVPCLLIEEKQYFCSHFGAGNLQTLTAIH